MILKSGSYEVNGRVVNSDGSNNERVWTISKEDEDNKVYTYDEAVNLTGHGPYSLLMLFATFCSVTGMVMDIFAFPSVAYVAACDLQLDTNKEKILFSIPFIGPVLGAYPMGYLADTRGRRYIMLKATWVGFITSFLSALSPHWIVIVFLKLISVACSSCCMSIAYTMVGESCGVKVKTMYCYIISSALHLAFPFQLALQYMSLTLDFSINIGLINFLPWRLLAILYALPIGGCAISLHFLYESPKYLVNAGREAEAVTTLAKIWKRNRQSGKMYPVRKIALNEDATLISGVPLWQSLKDQIVPLFTMPLLLRSLQLYFLVWVIYGSVGGLLVWFPYLVDAFISGTLTDQNGGGLCSMISHQAALIEAGSSSISCTPKSSLAVTWAALTQASILTIITCSVGYFRKRRKLFIITVLLVPGLAALGCATIDNVASLVTYFTISLASVGVGTLMAYFVDLYPTSYRGMAASLSIMVARFSNIITINIVGSLFRNHCNATFSYISAIFLSGALVSCFLPSDKTIGLK